MKLLFLYRFSLHFIHDHSFTRVLSALVWCDNKSHHVVFLVRVWWHIEKDESCQVHDGLLDGDEAPVFGGVAPPFVVRKLTDMHEVRTLLLRQLARQVEFRALLLHLRPLACAGCCASSCFNLDTFGIIVVTLRNQTVLYTRTIT